MYYNKCQRRRQACSLLHSELCSGRLVTAHTTFVWRLTGLDVAGITPEFLRMVLPAIFGRALIEAPNACAVADWLLLILRFLRLPPQCKRKPVCEVHERNFENKLLRVCSGRLVTALTTFRFYFT
jgi:hypothetical protein